MSGHFNSLDILHNNGTTILLEERPQVRIFWFKSKPYPIPMPWMYYFIKEYNYSGGWDATAHYRIVKLFCSPHRIKNVHDRFCRVPIPNLYSHRPCYSGAKSGLSFEDGVHDAITNWWSQNANDDAYPVTNPVVKHLLKNSGHRLIGNDSWKQREKAQRQVFKEWSKLSLRKSLQLPYSQTKWTAAKVFRDPDIKITRSRRVAA